MLGFFRFKKVWFFKALDATYKIIYLLFSIRRKRIVRLNLVGQIRKFLRV